jgi:hypothetical protein
MISWETTVAPQTSFSGSTEQSDVRRNNPGGGASVTLSDKATTTSSYNWSRTEYYSTLNKELNPGGPVFGNTSTSYVSVLGTTNSTQGNSYTLRSVINITSTEATREYTYRATGTETVETTAHTTTVFEGESQTFAWSVPAISTITTTTGFATAAESRLTTTTGADTIATPIRATVLVADKNEVIWAANTTAATALSALQAASSVATSGTRFTIMPHTATMVALAANATETTEVALPLVSGSFEHAQSNFTVNERPIVEDYNFLPHQTSLGFGGSFVTLATNRQFTVVAAETITATKSRATETRCAQSTTTALAHLNGESFSSSQTLTSTFSREHTLLTAESSTVSMTETVLAYNIPSNSPITSQWTAYTWTQTFASTTSNQLTTFQRQSQGMTTSAATPLQSYEGRSGVVDVSGSAKLGYTMASTIGLPDDVTQVQISRNLSSVFPATRQFLSEEGASYISATLSGMSATLAFPGSTSTTTTTTSVSAFGDAPRVYGGTSTLRSAIDAASLGQSETLYFTLPRGVYSANGSTFSTTGKTTSLTAGEGPSSAAPLPVSFIVGTTSANAGNQIWWTVSRNSHASLQELTQAAAYSAP